MNITFNEIEKLNSKMNEMRFEYWLNDVFFTFQWWLLLFILVVPWIVWWKVVDKKRVLPILLFGTLILTVVHILDELGVNLDLWHYPIHFVPTVPGLIPVDVGIIVVLHMLLYQYFRSWKTFIIANVIMSALFTFVAEPITVWLGIYKLTNWEYIYSFPIYIIKAVIIRAFVEKLIRLSSKP